MHRVVTKDFPENAVGGIMVCGINFGYSVKDEAFDNSGEARTPEPHSFFSDLSVNDTRFRNTALKWLKSWDLPFTHVEGQETPFDRSVFQTNWLDTQTRSDSSDGPITVELMVKQADGVLRLIEERKPSAIIFFGVTVIEALNDIRLRERVVAALGERSGNANVHQASPENYKGRRFKMRTQHFGDTFIVSVPHPQTRGITDAYVAALKADAQPLIEWINQLKNEQ